MATDNTEVGSFQDFLSKRQDGSNFESLDEAVRDFRRYQRELADARNKVQVGIEQSNRGEWGKTVQMFRKLHGNSQSGDGSNPRFVSRHICRYSLPGRRSPDENERLESVTSVVHKRAFSFREAVQSTFPHFERQNASKNEISKLT